MHAGVSPRPSVGDLVRWKMRPRPSPGGGSHSADAGLDEPLASPSSMVQPGLQLSLPRRRRMTIDGVWERVQVYASITEPCARADWLFLTYCEAMMIYRFWYWVGHLTIGGTSEYLTQGSR